MTLRWKPLLGDGAVKESVSDAAAFGGGGGAMLGDGAVKENVGDAAVEAAVGRW